MAFDPTVRESEPITLLGVEYAVKEPGGKTLQKLAEHQDVLESLDDADAIGAAERFCQIIELLVVDGDGLGERLFESFMAESDGVSMPMLMRAARHVQAEMADAGDAGNE